jgi:hypothetical protein
MTGVPRSTFAHVIEQQRETVRRMDGHCRMGRRTFVHQKHEGEDPDVEEVLREWFCL